jgi:choline dehydrogenase-like flavoprotein
LSRQFDLLLRGSYWRLARKQLFVPATVPLRLIARIEQAPDRSNQITLSDQRDRFGLPKARIAWKPTAPDELCFRSAVRNLMAYWQRAGFDRLCPLLLKPFVLDPDGLLTSHANDCAHPSGSTRMGLDPRSSVVGPDLRCHAIPNVALASTSVFPSAGSANPTYTLMLMALWLVDTF